MPHPTISHHSHSRDSEHSKAQEQRENDITAIRRSPILHLINIGLLTEAGREITGHHDAINDDLKLITLVIFEAVRLIHRSPEIIPPLRISKRTLRSRRIITNPPGADDLRLIDALRRIIHDEGERAVRVNQVRRDLRILTLQELTERILQIKASRDEIIDRDQGRDREIRDRSRIGRHRIRDGGVDAVAAADIGDRAGGVRQIREDQGPVGKIIDRDPRILDRKIRRAAGIERTVPQSSEGEQTQNKQETKSSIHEIYLMKQT